MGKGSNARPFAISKAEFDQNYDKIFGTRNEKRKSTANTDQSTESIGPTVEHHEPELGRESSQSVKDDTGSTTTDNQQ